MPDDTEVVHLRNATRNRFGISFRSCRKSDCTSLNISGTGRTADAVALTHVFGYPTVFPRDKATFSW